ncbi:MAG: hypothetical protein HY562_09570 [Ignavibacteriales bacterium]|nr:hypothetical protein [Ignavibacteriales bacterium]
MTQRQGVRPLHVRVQILMLEKGITRKLLMRELGMSKSLLSKALGGTRRAALEKVAKFVRSHRN